MYAVVGAKVNLALRALATPERHHDAKLLLCNEAETLLPGLQRWLPPGDVEQGRRMTSPPRLPHLNRQCAAFATCRSARWWGAGQPVDASDREGAVEAALPRGGYLHRQPGGPQKTVLYGASYPR